MSLYLLITAKPLPGTPQFTRLNELYPVNWKVSDTQWLVRNDHANETSKELSEKLFPRTEDGVAEMVHAVFLISSWFGWHDRGMWEWLQKNRATPNG